MASPPMFAHVVGTVSQHQNTVILGSQSSQELTLLQYTGMPIAEVLLIVFCIILHYILDVNFKFFLIGRWECSCRPSLRSSSETVLSYEKLG